MDTVMAMVCSAVADGRAQAHQGAASWRRTDRKIAADILHPFAHVAHAISGSRRLLIHAGGAATVVLDFESERGGLQRHPDPNGRGPGMAHDVGDRFLGGEKRVMPDFGR